MQQTQDISEKVFLELKAILKTLSDTKNIEEFLNLNDKNTNLQDYISYLRVRQNFKDIILEEPVSEYNEKEETSKIDDSNIIVEENITNEISKEEDFLSNDTLKILEQKHEEEKKFRLSKINSNKTIEPLIKDVFLDKNTAFGGNTKNNDVSTFYNETEKAKPLFKLDLNDRIAFTKKLFSGNQTDLNDAVARLNSFETLEEAKEYLSEIYYDKKWDKEDEFAQRLWNLVENKFQ
jgi:hypothetical protein